MHELVVMLAKAAAPSPSQVDANLLVAVGGGIAGVAALIGAWIKYRQHLNEQVAKEVDAKIGGIFTQMLTLETEARGRLDDNIRSVESRSTDLMTALEEKERNLRQMLDDTAVLQQQTTQLLTKLEPLMPFADAAGALPMALLQQAIESKEALTTIQLLTQILNHPESDGVTLELAGDQAKDLGIRSLAKQLYERSLEREPGRITTQAELYGLQADSLTERDQARGNMIRLAKGNPSDGAVVNALVNFFLKVRDYRGLIEVAMDLMDQSAEKALLWRNIAVARQQIGQPATDVEDAYEKALSLGDDGDYVNAARPYGRYLLDQRQYDRAEEVILKAIRFSASRGELHQLRGDLCRAKGDYSLASQCYEMAYKLGDAQDKIIAQRRIIDLSVLREIGLWPDGRASTSGRSTGYTVTGLGFGSSAGGLQFPSAADDDEDEPPISPA